MPREGLQPWTMMAGWKTGADAFAAIELAMGAREARGTERGPVADGARPAGLALAGAGGVVGTAGGRVPVCHWANRLSSAVNAAVMWRWKNRCSTRAIQPPDISPARAAFSPEKGLRAGAFMVRTLEERRRNVQSFLVRRRKFSWAEG